MGGPARRSGNLTQIAAINSLITGMERNGGMGVVQVEIAKSKVWVKESGPGYQVIRINSSNKASLK